MPEETHTPAVDLRSLTAHLTELDLDPATLELLMAVLTIDVSDPVEVASAIRS
jgi:hypothetical protein